MVHLLACADVRPSRQLLPSCQRPERSCCACAGVNQWLVAVGGRTAEIGWFRTRTDTFHNDVALVDCTQPALQWRAPPVEGEPPLAREFHTLSALSSGRLLLFGGGARPHLQMGSGNAACSPVVLSGDEPSVSGMRTDQP